MAEELEGNIKGLPVPEIQRLPEWLNKVVNGIRFSDI
jgi:hypothetical protein